MIFLRDTISAMRWPLAAVVVAIVLVAVVVIRLKYTHPRDTDNHNSTMPASTLTLSTPSFAGGGIIPAKYTCDGEQINPPLSISGVPAGTLSLALIMDDPDVPKALKPDGVFDHWVLFNIPPETKEIASGVTVGEPGVNGSGKNQYAGPCPPPQYEPSTHRYFFKLYALDITLPLQVGATKTQVEKAMETHILAEAQLVGTYKRQ